MLTRYPTPSGLPPVEFREPDDVWQFGGSSKSDLELILRSGIWPPPRLTGIEALKLGRGMDVWVASPRVNYFGALATIFWWESRRPVFNAVLLSVGVPSVLIMLLAALVRAWVFRLAGGSGSYHDPVDFSLLAGAVVMANLAYSFLCFAEVMIRALARPRTHIGLDLWQFCVIFSLAAIAVSFFLSLPFALGLNYTVPL